MRLIAFLHSTLSTKRSSGLGDELNELLSTGGSSAMLSFANRAASDFLPAVRNAMPDPAKQNITDHCDIAVIGGGASGMVSAICARKYLGDATREPCSISLFERNARLGKKLLVTGNGRCNLTNLDEELTRFHGGNAGFVKFALSQYPPAKVITFFEQMGVLCTIEEDQKIYPASLRASSVLDALRLALDENNISLYMQTMIKGLSKAGNQFILHSADGISYKASSVIIATGGMSAPATGSDGNGYRLLTAFAHELAEPVPSIVQIVTDTGFVKPLSGNKIRGTVSLYINGALVRTENGEILFTDYGLSGPPVLQLSGYVSRALDDDKKCGRSSDISILLDFLPNHSPDDVTAILRNRRNIFPGRNLEEYLTGLFQRRLAYGLMKSSIKKPLSAIVANLTDNEIAALAQSCKALRIRVTGTKSFAHAQATAGGIKTSGFDASTMGSRHCPGLFACGEILDIDGDCGGFNLHWAWASGFLAGSSAAKYVCEILS
jgi:predicted Rossmann fold flavoprotein